MLERSSRPAIPPPSPARCAASPPPRRGGRWRWWAQDVDPTSLVLPGPLRDPQRYVARYFFYPWWLKRDAKRARLVHILDHSYAHMVTRVHRRPVVVTVHDLMPVIILRSPTDGWREGIRNRFLRQTLKALRLAQAYIVGTDWLKHELATWLGDDRRISVVPFGVDRSFFSGLPVVTSGAGGLKEVGGDAIVVVEGRDPAAYVQALEALSDDPARMELLIARGRVRAREFSWQKTAERTAEVYRTLL